jgi:bacteriocin-like protein
MHNHNIIPIEDETQCSEEELNHVTGGWQWHYEGWVPTSRSELFPISATHASGRWW